MVDLCDQVEEADLQERTLSHIASGFHFNASVFLFGDADADDGLHFDVDVGADETKSLLDAASPPGVDGPASERHHQVIVHRDIVVVFCLSHGIDGSFFFFAKEWVLPDEAFQPRHEIKDRSPPPEKFPSQRCWINGHKTGSSFPFEPPGGFGSR